MPQPGKAEGNVLSTERGIIVRRIIEHCTGLDGFLVQLRTWNRFDEASYDTLVADLTSYHALLDTNPLMERQVAGCLFELQHVLDNTIVHAADHPRPYLTLVERAQVEIEDLIMMICFGPQKQED